MSDQAHVQTKALQSLAESRELSLVIINNPSADIISNYRTAIDPALTSAKILPVDQRIVDLANEPVPAWLSRYGTGVSKDEIWHKTTLNADGVRQVFVGDGPWVQDLGPVIEIPSDDPITADDGVIPPLSDKFHEAVVSDTSPCDVTIVSGAQFPHIPYFTTTSARVAQAMLFPVSSRHVVKTSNGVLHAVTSYAIDGLSRIVYLKSVNGGETWSQTIVDNNDGRNYVTPSITCDKDDGIHITYSRWDVISNPTYWLYASALGVPTGFEDVSSDINTLGYHRSLGGGNGVTYPNIGIDPDLYQYHLHTASLSGGASNSSIPVFSATTTRKTMLDGYHHTQWLWTQSLTDLLTPLSKTLRLLRYQGIPPYLPPDIVVPFSGPALPAGYSRYSDQDGYCVFISNDVGTIVGTDSHRHTYNYDISGASALYGIMNGSDAACGPTHTHVGSLYSAYANNHPPRRSVVFGRVGASGVYYLHNGALVMSGGSSILGMTLFSGAGGYLENRYLVGGTTFTDLGGTLTHDHTALSQYTNGPTSTIACFGAYPAEGYYPDFYAGSQFHGHLAEMTFGATSNMGSRVVPNIHNVDSDILMSTYGNDMFYRYISPEDVYADPVNISQIYQYFPSVMGVCLADNVDDKHFLWSAQGLNTTANRPRISYKKMTSGTLGSRVDLTTSDDGMYYPSMDIDVIGDIHTMWYNDTTQQSIEYRKFTSGAWQSVEIIDNNVYCSLPSNLITDLNCNVYAFFTRYSDLSTRIREMCFSKRTSSWGAVYNISPNKSVSGYSQYPGQTYLDNKGNVIVTWSGMGYGAHASVYHPVYRVILPDDTVYPPLTEDAVDLFPDDDTEIIYPTVFWHSNPLMDQIYHNLVVSGFSFIYLYNVRGTTGDVADIKFYSSPGALVGDSGPLGVGGSGDNDLFPGGVGGESVLSQESYTIVTRGYVCRSHLNNMSLIDNYLM